MPAEQDLVSDEAEVEELLRHLGLAAADGTGAPANSVAGASSAKKQQRISKGTSKPEAALPVPTPDGAISTPPAKPPAPPTIVVATPSPSCHPVMLEPAVLGDLLCPITQEPMRDPVLAADGTTYERRAIEGG
jgi:hypothetical protein